MGLQRGGGRGVGVQSVRALQRTGIPHGFIKLWAKVMWAKVMCAKELWAKELCAKELCAKELCPIERWVNVTCPIERCAILCV